VSTAIQSIEIKKPFILGRFEESIPTRNALSFEQRSRREILPCAISRRVRRQIRFFL